MISNVTVTSRPSIRQVAEIAGVSRMTVSRVLNGRAHLVTEETRQRVLEVVSKLEYVPVAPPMIHGRDIRTGIIGLVFDGAQMESTWGMSTFWGMREAAIKHDYDLLTLLKVRPDWMMDQEELQFLDRRSDGFIFIAPQNRRQTLEALVKHKLPVVACFCFENGVPKNVPVVTLDNANAMHLAVRHLIAQGHQRILHLTSSLDRTDFKERRRGFDAAMEQAGLSPEVLLIRELRESGAREKLLTALARHHITAVACATDMLAHGVWDIAEDMGMKVPRDISITGMDDLKDSAARGLTSICYSSEEVGRRAIEAVIGLMRGGDVKSMNSVVPVELALRSSVAPPP
jgi:LacI family transcriptional regulator